LLQFLSQFHVVVDFPIEGDAHLAVGRPERLMTCGAYIDDGKSAMADTNPVLNLPRLNGPLASLNAASAILGQEILMGVPLRIYEGNAFIVRTSVSHSSKTSTKLGRVRLMCLKEVISSYSAHCSASVSSFVQQAIIQGSFPVSCMAEHWV